ncbi:MAG: hypothetical protein FWH01_06340 [Oscillospiraceae bacterium]|nr:hypothetical protein [Oscillospiraceae bacterium]
MEMDSKSCEIWRRPVLAPLPDHVAGVACPVVSLDGVWKITLNPVEEYWKNEVSPAAWDDIDVPSQTTVKGFFPENKKTYAYKTKFAVPCDFEGKTIKLRLDAVNCYARVYVDGRFVRDHYGGFNGWDADVTDFVTAGEAHTLAVGVQDRLGEMSQFSMGGIIRSVRLYALPTLHIERMHVETDLDRNYRDATLRVALKLSAPGGTTPSGAVSGGAVSDGTTPGDAAVDLSVIGGTAVDLSAIGGAMVELTLTEPDGRAAPLGGPIHISDDLDHEYSYAIKTPLKWDSEHPNLYRLDAKLMVDGASAVTINRNIGFRKIEIRGNVMYVNGDEVKLRGVNREEVHPLRGRATTHEDIRRDFWLFKEANVNFVRTSHYNPDQYFLDLCDEHGVYVELESSVSFVGQGQDQTSDDPDFTARYMDQFAEMIEMNRSRPSVIIWSLANECIWGDNFRLMAKYARSEDPGRPIIFSYPITIQDDDELPDIWSAHYGELATDTSIMVDNHDRGEHFGRLPVLHDEYIHIPCYDHSELIRDPMVRDFWGESIKRFWDNIFDTPGALGGAIWGGIDEVHWDGRGGGAEWGVIDGFRRVKPEHWHTKKGYSPIRIENRPIGTAKVGVLTIPVYNRYNHTNLNEVSITWSIAGKSGTQAGPDLPPRARGAITMRVGDVPADAKLRLTFTEPNGIVCDEYELSQAKEAAMLPDWQRAGAAPRIIDGSGSIEVSGECFSLVFSKETGLITCGCYCGEKIIHGGPYLNLVGMRLSEWSLSGLSASMGGLGGNNEGLAEVVLRGAYGKVRVTFLMQIDGSGLMKTTYTIDDMPYNPPRSKRMVVGVDVGGYAEVGVSFLLSSRVDALSWQKDGLWDYYPDNHIGRLGGVAWKKRRRGGEGHEVCEGRDALDGRDTREGLDALGGRDAREVGDVRDGFEVRVRRDARSGLNANSPVVPQWDWKDDILDYTLYGFDDAGGRGTKDFSSSKTCLHEAAAIISETGAALRCYSDGRDTVRMEALWDEATTIDDRDPRVKYYGNWFGHEDIHGCYKDTETLSNTPGDYAEIEFDGTGISWISTRYLTYGMADVYVDGNLIRKEADLFPRMGSGTSRGYERQYRNHICTVTGLEAGKHTLRIVVTGKKRQPVANQFRPMQAYNCYVAIDCFRLLGVEGAGGNTYASENFCESAVAGVSVGAGDSASAGLVRMNINNEWNFNQLCWGNYMKAPIMVEDGYTGSVYVKLDKLEGSGENA